MNRSGDCLFLQLTVFIWTVKFHQGSMNVYYYFCFVLIFVSFFLCRNSEWHNSAFMSDAFLQDCCLYAIINRKKIGLFMVGFTVNWHVTYIHLSWCETAIQYRHYLWSWYAWSCLSLAKMNAYIYIYIYI